MMLRILCPFFILFWRSVQQIDTLIAYYFTLLKFLWTVSIYYHPDFKGRF